MTKRISDAVRARVRKQAGNRCGYCQSLQEYVFVRLEIEHIVPKARGGTDDETNLWLSCRLCNHYKSTQTYAYDRMTKRYVRLFNPRRQYWKSHFRWSKDGLCIIGRTACGRATVQALQLNNDIAVMVRQNWVKAGWHPPQD